MSQNPQYGQPGFYPPAGPPPRRGTPWWVWMLGGCGGCAVICVIAFLAVGFMGMNFVKDMAKSVGPVTAASVKQSLGPEVPQYPNATLQEVPTQATLTTVRTIEKVAGRAPGAIFRGVGMYLTQDPPQKVVQFYDNRLPKAGWKRTRTESQSAQEQRVYQKGQEVIMVQAQPQSGAGTMIVLMRGGPEMVDKAPQQ